MCGTMGPGNKCWHDTVGVGSGVGHHDHFIQMTTPPKRILLGEIVAAHGIRGEVGIKTYTAEPEAIGDYGLLSDATGQRSFEITGLKMTAKGIVARIKGVTDRTGAEALKGTGLYVARAALPEAAEDEGEYYNADLIGLAAVAPDGTALGTIVSVENFGAGDLIEIKFAGRNATEFVPFTDACVPTVDIAGGKVTVILPEIIEGDPPPGEPGADEPH
jgi:16S rRNA processing protein RimM